MLSSLLAPVLVSAVQANTLTETKIVEATLFKNGYSVIRREAKIPDNGELVVEAPPEAVLGTFWLQAEDGKLLSATTGYRTVSTNREPRSLDEVLSLAKNQEVTIWAAAYADQPKELRGKFEFVSNDVIGFRETGQSTVTVMSRHSINRVRIESTAKLLVPDNEQQAVLKISGLRGTKVHIVTMQKGLGWAPAYHITIDDSGKLDLVARGVIMSDNVAFKDLTVQLVTGFPNLPFLGQVDPMSIAPVIRQVISSAPMQMGGAYGGGMGGARREAQFANMASDGFSGISSESVSGFAAEDLFLYPQNKITIAPNERVYRQLFRTQSDYTHVYTIQLPLTIDQNGNSTRNDQVKPEAWHVLKFKNSAKLPLTTGPAIVMKNGSMIGQDTLTYTSVDQDVRVKVAKALEISARNAEEEISRERGFIKDNFGNPRFDRITIQGKIEIYSRMAKAVRIEASKDLYGTVVKSSERSVTEQEPGAIFDQNPKSTIKWEIDAKPGEKTVLTYQYTLMQRT